MSEEQDGRIANKVLKNGMTPKQVIDIFQMGIDQGLFDGEGEECIRGIVEYQIERARSQSPFSTLELVYDKNNVLFLCWAPNWAEEVKRPNSQ